MESRARTLIITGIVALIILGIILAVIFYLGSTIRNRFSGVRTNTPTASVSPNASAEGGAITESTGNTKAYSGSGFSLKYPSNWGLLTCSNTINFELDPTSNADQTNVTCDYATKPITVIVGGGADCVGGETGTIGSVSLRKITTTSATGTDYRWCTQTMPTLDITHRVSKDGSRASSKEDYSAQIEQLIFTINFAEGGS